MTIKKNPFISYLLEFGRYFRFCTTEKFTSIFHIVCVLNDIKLESNLINQVLTVILSQKLIGIPMSYFNSKL